MARTQNQVVVYPVVESDSLQYRISHPDLFFDRKNDADILWVNLTGEDLEVVLPTEIAEDPVNGGPFVDKKFQGKKHSIPVGNTVTVAYKKPVGNSNAPEPDGVYSYTILGAVSKLKVIGHSDPRIIIYGGS
ncbi:MAG: hypothetical protein JSU96_09065 [Acidobacteriota bacterium]|nr:MAG: hypothetical protein JSU96_09065 [Acidobacteriota bacterium]